MISLDDALGLVAAVFRERRTATDTISPAGAAGRVLAADAASPRDIPPFDRVLMDGYAVPPAPESRVYRIAGSVPAGTDDPPALESGTALKVMTGARAPQGTGRVVPVENTRERDGWVEILDTAATRHVSPRGEDVREGETVIAAGVRLSAAAAAGLVACGVPSVEVGRRPRVTVLATGDELVRDPADLTPGRIVDANSPMLAGLLRGRGYDPVLPDPVPDDPGAVRSAIEASLDRGELTVVTGGVSMGDWDHVPGALEDLGLEIVFSRVMVKPGKPMTLAVGPRGAVLALPGNPVSSFVACHLYVLPALALMEGEASRPRFLELPLAEPFTDGFEKRLRLLPARLDATGGVIPLPMHTSGHLHSLIRAEGLLRIEAGGDDLPAGAVVPFWPIAVAPYAAPLAGPSKEDDDESR